MRNLIAILTVFSASLALAEVGNFEIKGMTCGACVKRVKAAVCDKLGDTAETCEVKVGSMSITTKAGKTLDTKQVEALVAGTKSFSVTKSEIKK